MNWPVFYVINIILIIFTVIGKYLYLFLFLHFV